MIILLDLRKKHMLSIHNITNFVLTVNENDIILKTHDIDIDHEFLMAGVLNEYIEFYYDGSKIRVPIEDYSLAKEGDLTVVHIDVSPEWEKRIFAFCDYEEFSKEIFEALGNN